MNERDEYPEGWLNGEEIALLREYASGQHRVLEVGTWRGRSAFVLAEVCGTLWCVDPHGDHPAGPSWGPFLTEMVRRDAKNIIPIRATFEEADELMLLPELVDFVFIDGDHSLDAVRHDLEVALLELLAPTIAVHDFEEKSYPGVTQAVTEFCEKHGWHIIDRTEHLVILEAEASNG